MIEILLLSIIGIFVLFACIIHVMILFDLIKPQLYRVYKRPSGFYCIEVKYEYSPLWYTYSQHGSMTYEPFLTKSEAMREVKKLKDRNDGCVNPKNANITHIKFGPDNEIIEDE